MASISEFHTYDEWKALGFHVLKGQKSGYRGTDGKARFGPSQVATYSYDDDGDYEGSIEQCLGSWDWYK